MKKVICWFKGHVTSPYALKGIKEHRNKGYAGYSYACDRCKSYVTIMYK